MLDALKRTPIRLDEEEEEEDKKKNKEGPDPFAEKFLKTRQVLLSGEINAENAEKVIRQLFILEADSDKPIYVFIDSPGGEVDAGFAIFDAIRFVNAPVYTIGMGLIASAAALILLAAPKERRLGLPHSRYLIHQPSAGTRDFIIIDCSPSLGLVTVNSLTAADSVIIPVQCEYFALEGLGKLLNTIKIVQNRLNPDLDIEGILLTMFDTRLRLSKQVVEEVKMHFQDMVFDTIINRNTRLSEAPSFGKTIIMHDAGSTGAINYLNLAREILEKNHITTKND